MPAISQAEKAVAETRGDAEIAEFDEQIIGFADRVRMGLIEDALQILE